ncbi:alanine racemase [Paenibacillus humicus]|uniref:alanine racemase n=1 Tax=Paenibacillus humicus TaxID=412861 RepID=UPI003F5CDCDB
MGEKEREAMEAGAPEREGERSGQEAAAQAVIEASEGPIGSGDGRLDGERKAAPERMDGGNKAGQAVEAAPERMDGGNMAEKAVGAAPERMNGGNMAEKAVEAAPERGCLPGGELGDEGPQTPFILIRSARVDANIASMAEAAARRGVKLRPHVKTHKLPELAARQLAAGAVGITAAKLSEAEVMADGGVGDIFIAYPVMGAAKARRAASLAQRCRLAVGVDSAAGARHLSAAAEAAGIALEVRLEIETGLRRTGVAPEAALPLAREIAAMPGLDLSGIFTYRGAMLGGAPTMDLRAAGHEEGRMMAAVAQELRRGGVPIRDVSVGSTPTAVYAAEIEGVTEIRPGTYVFHDRMQAAFGLCKLDDCAAEVWVTVVSRPATDRIVIDGGSKTFATDVQPGGAPLQLQGFGHVVGLPHAVFERMNEEHGVIRVRPEDDCQPGDLLRVIPNHICSTVNLHSSVYISDKDGGLRRVPVAARGCIQ